MGKGDKKTRRGKIHIGSYGRLRPVAKKSPAFVKVEKIVEPEVPEQPEPIVEVPPKKVVKRAPKKPKAETE